MRIGAINRIIEDNIYLPDSFRKAAESGLDPKEIVKKAEDTGVYVPDSVKESLNISDDTRAGKVETNPGESTKVAPGRKSSPAECKTCAERKYQDGSDEMVSFKSAAHISPEASAARVRAHEQEHVSNAYKKAAKDGGKVLQASVTMSTAICPECGRSYVSGGLTTTRIMYREESPYEREKKALDAPAVAGSNFEAGI